MGVLLKIGSDVPPPAVLLHETISNYSDLVKSGNKRLITVASDETNGGETSLYYWTGTKLLYLVVQDVI